MGLTLNISLALSPSRSKNLSYSFDFENCLLSHACSSSKNRGVSRRHGSNMRDAGLPRSASPISRKQTNIGCSSTNEETSHLMSGACMFSASLSVPLRLQILFLLTLRMICDTIMQLCEARADLSLRGVVNMPLAGAGHLLSEIHDIVDPWLQISASFGD